MLSGTTGRGAVGRPQEWTSVSPTQVAELGLPIAPAVRPAVQQLIVTAFAPPFSLGLSKSQSSGAEAKKGGYRFTYWKVRGSLRLQAGRGPGSLWPWALYLVGLLCSELLHSKTDSSRRDKQPAVARLTPSRRAAPISKRVRSRDAASLIWLWSCAHS